MIRGAATVAVRPDFAAGPEAGNGERAYRCTVTVADGRTGT
jgi:hypothetical protein